MEKATIKTAIQALANLLIIRYLILQAVKAYRDLPNKLKDAEPGCAILMELEPQYYLSVAGILMTALFGKPGTKIGDLAYSVLEDWVKDDIAQNRLFVK